MSNMRTVDVLGVSLDVEYTGTPFIPAKTDGPPEDCYPAEGGEALVVAVLLEGIEIRELLNDWTINNITEQLVEYLCSDQHQEVEHEPA